MAEDDIARDATGATWEESLSDPGRGDLGLDVTFPFVPGLRNGDAVRLITGGVWVLDGGLLGRLMEGLSHDEKKSSPGSPDGVAVPAVEEGAAISVMITSSGYLGHL